MIWYLLLALMVATGLVGGFLGAIVGLGGAVVIVPILTLFLGVPIAYAAGAALVSAIATSSGSASSYVMDKVSNIKIGMSLEVGTTLGAIVGSLIVAYIYSRNLSSLVFVLFGGVLLVSLYFELVHRRHEHYKAPKPDSTTRIFQMGGSYYDHALRRNVRYNGIRWHIGEAVMFFAGVISGLLGVGSGVMKVVAMDMGMRLPTKVSTSTSNFMIGVTAAASSIVYWNFGYIQPFIAGTIAVGAIVGAYLGTKMFKRMHGRTIRMIFMVLLALMAVQMIAKGVGL